MSRLPRLHVPGGHYHVTLRGNHRNDIFFRPADRQRLDEILIEALDKSRCRLHAYCWMTNHLHLLVQVSDRPLGVLMQRVGTRFARAIQRDLATTGHLFERRYHALLIDVDSYFLTVLRYIHLNPVAARIVTHADEYRWSSHRVYLGLTEQSWVHTDFGLGLFHSDLVRARECYRQFMSGTFGNSTSPLDQEAHPKDRRVLGDDRFLESLSAEVKRKRGYGSLQDIATEICLQHRVRLEQLASASRLATIVRARDALIQRALDQQIATLSELARFLNRSAAAVSRAAARRSV